MLSNQPYSRGDTQKYRDVIKLIAALGTKKTFTPADIAVALHDLNPHHSAVVGQPLRRALRQAEGRGFIESFRFLSERGGNPIAYRVLLPIGDQDTEPDYPF